jgi:hypothetical protein
MQFVESQPTFRRNISSPLSGANKPIKIPGSKLSLEFILSLGRRLTMDGFWIDDRIYWTLWHNVWLHFTVHCYTHTRTHTDVHGHGFTSRCSGAGFNGGRSPSPGFPNCPRAQLQDCHSNGSRQRNFSSSLTHWLTHQPTHSTPLTNYH